MCYDISYRITLETLEEYFENIIFEDPQLEIDFDASIHMTAHAFSKQHIITFKNKIYHTKHSK